VAVYLAARKKRGERSEGGQKWGRTLFGLLARTTQSVQVDARWPAAVLLLQCPSSQPAVTGGGGANRAIPALALLCQLQGVSPE